MNTKVLQLAVFTVVVSACASASARANRFIAGGHEFFGLSPEKLLQHAAEYDKLPIDGVILSIETKGRYGNRISTWWSFNDPAWDYDDLAPLESKYREVMRRRVFANSLLSFYPSPHVRVAWTNDIEWARIAHNMRMAARLAKRGGFKGLQMDPEDYHAQRQYFLNEKDGIDFAAAKQFARRRARQVFQGVFEEFPDAYILSYWFLSMVHRYSYDIDGRLLPQRVERGGKDLWPSFIDGIFDALPPTAVLVDGDEEAYRYEASRNQFIEAACWCRSEFVWLLSPENRGKYRSQMQVSFGAYLDAYTFAQPGSWFYMGPRNGSRLGHLEENLRQAAKGADEMIWLWCEKGRWIGDKKNWESLLPGLHDTLLAVKDPAAYGRVLRHRREAGELKALNANSACTGAGSAQLPEPYSSWQREGKRIRSGTFGCDTTIGDGDSCSLVASNVQHGCILLSSKKIRPQGCKSGERFGLSFSSKGRHVSAGVHWTAGGSNDFAIAKIAIPVSDEVDDAGWAHTDWSFVIPEGADGFVVTLSANLDAGEKCWYDNVAIVHDAPKVAVSGTGNGK
ncbi:MAG: hypothetical protein IKC80_03070 [Kiritimatiellae bacterium]|nr:hypothetical protein [Kiritimatiellia bacterium]